MSEETHNAAEAAPKGIVWSVIISVIFGFILLVAMNVGIDPAKGADGLTGYDRALGALVPYLAMWGFIIVKREVLGNPDDLPVWYETGYGLAFAAFSITVIFAILAFFLRFKRSGWSILDPLQHDAYGIFLVHYAWMLWLQYWLFKADMPAIAKAAIVFVMGLLLSWGTTVALRRIPGAYKVL